MNEMKNAIFPTRAEIQITRKNRIKLSKPSINQPLNTRDNETSNASIGDKLKLKPSICTQYL